MLVTIEDIIHNCNHFFRDADILSKDNYVIINDQNEIFRNGKLLEIKGKYSLKYPKVSIISESQFLLIEAEIENQFEHNAWIINEDGSIENTFYLGSAHRVITTESKIIISYTDSQLDTNQKYGTNGIVVFDYKGNSLFEYYRDVPKADWIPILENYAFLKKDETTIYLLPFISSTKNFPIVEFSLENYSTKILFYLEGDEKNNIILPEKWRMPKAFSQKDDKWYFVVPDRENYMYSTIFEIDADMKLKEISNCCFSVYPKGLPNGQFAIPFSGDLGISRYCQFVEIK